MTSIFACDVERIARLDAAQLQGLLRKLLHLEAMTHGIERAGIHVTDPARITVPDGGEDGRIEWRGGPDHTDYCPRRTTSFQVKAKDMTHASCAAEVTRSANGTVVVADTIRCVLDAGGAYVMFCNRPYEGDKYQDRIGGIREGLKSGGYNAADTVPVDFYDANKIRDWVNSHPSAIQWVDEKVARVSLFGFQTWDHWAGNPDVSASAFVADDKLINLIRQLRSRIGQPRSATRLVGLSGLGKTRLAFEAFKPPPTEITDVAQQALSDSVLYVPSSVGGAKIVEVAAAMRDNQLPALLVVDDCEAALHAELARITKHRDSRMGLLTLDYEVPLPTDAQDVLIIDSMSHEVIRGILAQSNPSLPRPDMDRVVEFADGYPRLAVLLNESLAQGSANFGQLDDGQLLHRMLWGRRNPDEVGLKVMQTCSLFSALGIAEQVEDQMKFAAELAGTDVDTYYDNLKIFADRGLVQRRGRFVQAQPRPLALRLAADWWRHVNPSRARRLFQDPIPERLLESLCDQMRMLDNLKEARDIVRGLCGPDAPFGQAEVLNTEQGSRCFRSLVEVNPEACTHALDRAFAGWTTDRFLAVGPGRRNLVWALEKLAFRKELFPRAARLLLRLGAAENEDWSNNAKGIFLRLFRVYLAGTEAGPAERLIVVDDALVSSEPSIRQLAAEALDRALETRHFTRGGGPEQQGSGRPLEDWRPRTYKERNDYWREAIKRLTTLAVGGGEIGELARRNLAHHMRGLISARLLDEVEQIVEQLTQGANTFWPAALEQVSEALSHEGKDMPDDYRGRVQRLHQILFPSDLRNRVRLMVSSAPYRVFGQDEDIHTAARHATQEAEKLADECAQNREILFGLLPDLLHGEQRQFYPFGKRLGEILPTPKEFIDHSLSIIERSTQPNVNASLLSAFLGGLGTRDRQIVDETLDRVAHSATLGRHLVDLSRLLRIESGDLDRIVDAVQRGTLPVTEVRMLSYGQVLTHLSPEEIRDFVGAIAKISLDGVWVALEMLSFYTYDDLDRRDSLREQIRGLITTEGLLASKETKQSLDLHCFESSATWLLQTDEGRSDLAIHLVKEFIALCRQMSYPYHLEHLLRTLLIEILKRHGADAWLPLGSAIVSADLLVRDHLGSLLSSTSDKEHRDAQPIDYVPNDVLMQWCRTSPDVAPGFLLGIVPLLSKQDDGAISWTPLVQTLIDEFGDMPETLDALSSNMGTFGWTGSMVPYYEQYVGPLRSLLRHRFAATRDWAASELQYLERSISHEQGRDEERDFGIR